MKRTHFGTVIAIGIVLFFVGGLAVAGWTSDAILGKWYTENDKSIVEVVKRGNKFFGSIVWLKDPKEKDGTDKLDKNNPDPALRKKKVIGMELLRDFIFADNIWKDGRIYNPEDGKLYSCELKLIENGKKLDVRGFVGITLFGKTQIWRRAE
jgi:uncharacterized protein (DUF2147 family)